MSENRAIPEVSVRDLKARLEADRESFCLLDVREQHEHDIAKLDHHLHIPMGEVLFRIEELPGDRPILVLCRSGNRSASVTELLVAEGFDAHNVAGGLLAWADEIDPSMQKY